MEAYWFTFYEGLTDNYHSGGSVAVMAESQEEALAKIKAAHPGLKDMLGNPSRPYPNLYDSGKIGDKPTVFRDAGCC